MTLLAGILPCLASFSTVSVSREAAIFPRNGGSPGQRRRSVAEYVTGSPGFCMDFPRSHLQLHELSDSESEAARVWIDGYLEEIFRSNPTQFQPYLQRKAG